MTTLVENLIVIISKLIKFISNTFNLGSGYTWPGHVALLVNPNFLKSRRIRFKKGVVLVSGTNGKTTTTKLITHLLEKSGYTVSHNKSGANLLNGIASSIILDFPAFGDLNRDFGVFEVDEGALPLVLSNLKASAVVLLNLSRDQLDRYGEVDIISEKWTKSLLSLNPAPTLIVDGDKDYFNSISQAFKGDTIAFGDSVDYLSRTTIKQLYACGEVACTGMHGANRLGSNSLLEGLVTGYIAGTDACKSIQKTRRELLPYTIRKSMGLSKISWLDLNDIKNSLKSLMWRDAGIERNERHLLEAEEMIEMWSSYVMDKEFSNPAGWELQNMLLVSKLIVTSARKRKESRGVHHRTDYQKTDNIHWKKHILIKK
ncbi:MAG: hypothetical protein A2Z57_01265 [Planctomycetes bacterium RIFCSPHIGHO2_12_39_6]|nr:MAG: hypothetical protein A2Z57_01265 [Planctomycetes bacterium RIFCSPHIGHO2_12_39_6]